MSKVGYASKKLSVNSLRLARIVSVQAASQLSEVVVAAIFYLSLFKTQFGKTRQYIGVAKWAVSFRCINTLRTTNRPF